MVKASDVNAQAAARSTWDFAEATLQGVEERVIMKLTGHKSERVVRGYIREASVFQNNGAAAVGF